MDRPDLNIMKRSEAARYILHLEERIETLTADVASLQPAPGKPYGEGGMAFVSDSSTSRKAAIKAYPKKNTQRERVLKHLVTHLDRGATRDELCNALGLEVSSINPRVRELLEGGWARELSDKTRPTRSGNDASIITVTDKGHRAYLRTLEGLPPEPPKKKDGSPAAPPAHLIPDQESLLDQQEEPRGDHASNQH